MQLSIEILGDRFFSGFENSSNSRFADEVLSKKLIEKKISKINCKKFKENMGDRIDQHSIQSKRKNILLL